MILNQETKQPFTYSDACVAQGPTVAYHEAGSKQARDYPRTSLKVFAAK
jgi:hypothetical protein